MGLIDDEALFWLRRRLFLLDCRLERRRRLRRDRELSRDPVDLEYSLLSSSEDGSSGSSEPSGFSTIRAMFSNAAPKLLSGTSWAAGLELALGAFETCALFDDATLLCLVTVGNFVFPSPETFSCLFLGSLWPFLASFRPF